MPYERLPLPTLKEGLPVFFLTIVENLYHQDYERVCEIAEDYKIYITGEGASKKLIQFTPRETPEQFAQRLRVSKMITPDMAGGCTKYMYKVGRTPANILITWGDQQKDEKNKKELKDVANNFYGMQSVDQYLTYRMVELDSTDPNAFIVIEFTNSNRGIVDPTRPDTAAIPYPFEVKASEAVDFKYKNNILQWLIVKKDIWMKDRDNRKIQGAKYVLYMKDFSVVSEQFHKDHIEKFWIENPQAIKISNLSNVLDGTQELKLVPNQVYLLETEKKGNKGERYYKVVVYEHKIPFVPAQRVGTVRDLSTDGRTRVPLIHLARPYFEKAIKTVSEFDLTMCLHVFPQKIQYSESCPGYIESIEGSTEQHLHACIRGRTHEGHVCKQCSGSGFVVHKSASDMIQIAMPKRPEDFVSLENFIVYKYPPTELLEFQKKLSLYEFKSLAQRAVYNSESFTSEQILADKTATGENIDLDRVYDTLKPFADNYSEMWSFVMLCLCSLRDIGHEASGGETETKLPSIAHQFPNDFKMKSLTQLLDDLKKASESGAPSSIKRAINKDITRKYWIDDPDEIMRQETKDRYNPFPGKTDSQITYIMSNNLTTNKTKVFYSHFDTVFTRAEEAAKEGGGNLYLMELTAQKALIEKALNEIVTEVATEETQRQADAFKMAGNNFGG